MSATPRDSAPQLSTLGSKTPSALGFKTLEIALQHRVDAVVEGLADYGVADGDLVQAGEHLREITQVVAVEVVAGVDAQVFRGRQ